MAIAARSSLAFSRLRWTALATVVPGALAGTADTGPHGFSDIPLAHALWAHTSDNQR
jgi:K+-transporting ATPase A subunit